MSSWFRETPQSLRFLAEERAVLEATELVAECLERRDVTRTALAERLGIGRSEVTQRLSGKRNLTIKTLGAMLHELGYRLRLDVEDVATERKSHDVAFPAAILGLQAGSHYTNTGTALRLIKSDAA